MKIYLIIFLNFFHNFSLITTNPFILTENYLENFKKNLENLKNLSKTYNYHEENYDPNKYNETEAFREAHSYDFIIIGAGASGSVIANRLAEIPEWNILLLEAGTPETELTQVPNYYNLLLNTPYNWNFLTKPQKNWCLGMIDNQCPLHAGKAVGGSTAINGLVYTRGNHRDYDLWSDQGNEGWCFDDVHKYFKKIEDSHLQHFDRMYHNQGGPMHIENPQYLSPFVEKILSAGQELNLNTIDFNGEHQIGLGITQINTKYGKRHSASQAYLKPAEQRKNLLIKPSSYVIEIIINPHTKQAAGVKFINNDKLYVARANKEIILSAGALNTPKLLQLSGIGPKELLNKFNIETKVELNVGKNFKDHIGFFGLDFIYKGNENPLEYEQDPILDYLKNGKGPLTTSGIEIIGYLQTDESKDGPNYPDIELIFIPKQIGIITDSFPFRIRPEIGKALWKPLENQTVLNVAVMLTHPKSIGSVYINDKNPLHNPIIDSNQLSDLDQNDLNTLLAGIKKTIKLIQETKSLKDIFQLNPNPLPECAKINEFLSDNYWKCAIKHLTISLRHYSGTAKMGPNTDKDAVVDNKLKVYGVEKLRIADASIIPVSITGHTMAPSLMIGEKVADLIKDHWK